MEEYGVLSGEVCGRDGCPGIIAEHEAREGEGCTCHLCAPCSYCTTSRAYCPVCGWEASDECDAWIVTSEVSDSVSRWRYRSPQEQYDALEDGCWGSVIWSGWGSGMVVRGKHPGLSRGEILERLGCASKECMAQFKEYTEGSFMVSYFTD